MDDRLQQDRCAMHNTPLLGVIIFVPHAFFYMSRGLPINHLLTMFIQQNIVRLHVPRGGKDGKVAHSKTNRIEG